MLAIIKKDVQYNNNLLESSGAIITRDLKNNVSLFNPRLVKINIFSKDPKDIANESGVKYSAKTTIF